MDIQSQIKELEKQLRHLKNIQHNQGMNGVASEFVRQLKAKPTSAELKFMEIAKAKGLNLDFQHRIDIVDKEGRILQFFIVDFCDVANKIVFEIDGDYHKTPEQQKKDFMRTRKLNKEGYRVFRISNEDVLINKKTTSLLYSAYPKLSSKVLKKVDRIKHK